MKKIIFVLFFLINPGLIFAEDIPSSNILRVAILVNVPFIEISLPKSYSIKGLSTNELLKIVSLPKRTKVFPSGEGLRIGEKFYKVSGIRVKSSDEDGEITINGRRYRGEIEIIKTKDLNLLVVNLIDLEKYLYGVLQREVSRHWPIEVLKAQAIASRTYALYQMKVNKDKDYHLTSDFYSQVYGGKDAEKYRTTKAVRLTKSQVLTYAGEIFPAYFHATCGGVAEDASELWNINIPPLKGGRCDFCYLSPHYIWERFIPLRELKEKLNASGYPFRGKILGIIPKERNASGRIRRLKIITEGKEFEISAKEFRQIFDPQIIRSTNFDVELEPDGAIFRGYGWGHGVGLCQWGAYFMAIKGYKAEKILEFYYPQTEIKKID